MTATRVNRFIIWVCTGFIAICAGLISRACFAAVDAVGNFTKKVTIIERLATDVNIRSMQDSARIDKLFQLASNSQGRETEVMQQINDLRTDVKLNKQEIDFIKKN